MFDLNKLDWKTGRYVGIHETAEIESNGKIYQVFLGDVNQHVLEVNLALVDQETGQSYDTRSTRDWPIFDELFGRDEWQEFEAKKTAEIYPELDEELDED